MGIKVRMIQGCFQWIGFLKAIEYFLLFRRFGQKLLKYYGAERG